MKKDIEEIKTILAEIQQRIMYIEECQRRQSQRRQRQVKRQRQSKTLQEMERTKKEDPVTIQWQGPYNQQQTV